jgi:hypothetical protein
LGLQRYHKNRSFFHFNAFTVFTVFLPWVFLLIFLFLFHVDVPTSDQWSLVSVIEKTFQGELTFMDLWAQHNGHYIIVPKSIIVGLAYLTNWNSFYEVIVGFLFSSASFLLLCKSIFSVKELAESSNRYFVFPIISLFMFSLNQWQNWYLGFQICIFINVFFMIQGFVFLSRSSYGWFYWVAAFISGVIATLSFASGLLYWVIALLLIILMPMEKKREKIGKIFLWFVVSVCVYCIYLFDFSGQTGGRAGSGLLNVIDNPVAYFGYVFIYLGAPLFSYAWGIPYGFGIVFFTGLIGTILFICFCIKHIHQGNMIRSGMFVFQAIGLYAIGSAFLTGLARVEYGYLQALSSRYITISLLLWISNIVFLFQHMSSKRDLFGYLKIFSKKNAAVLTSIIFIMIFLDSVYGSIMAVKKHREFQLIRDSILVPSDDDEVKRLRKIYGPYSDAGVEILRRNKLSLFRSSKD